MNRRRFFRLGAAGAMALPGFESKLLAQQDSTENPRHRILPLDHAPGLVGRALTTPVAGFPTIEPIFGGIFTPGSTNTQLISANGFTSLNTQVQALAAQGYRLTALTAIRNMNATWYYAAFQPGTGNYQLVRTSDPNAFQQTFATNKSGFALVDFAITWELNELYYVGYWLAVSSPANQTLLWQVSESSLSTQTNTLSGQNMRMIRIQPSPNQDVTVYTALFQPGNGSWEWYYIGLPNFPNKVTQSFAGLTLSGLGYDLVSGDMIGCWNNKIAGSQFVWDLDWNTLQSTAQQMAANGLVLTAVSAYPNAPDFDDYFAANLQPFVMGYAYSLAYNGKIVSEGYGYSRGPQQPNNPNTPFMPTSRCNLASVSKWITAIALEVLILKYPAVTLDTPFWPLISSMVPNPDPSVKTVTLRNLATMKSGMLTPPNEGPFYGTLWPYLNTYLAMPLVGTPGVTYSYNNENFTILQGVIDQVTGVDYVTWVTQNVLVPAGINTSVFNPVPDPQTTATLSYLGPTDPNNGDYWTQIDFVAPAGWISSSQELLKILLALRNTSVLPASAISEMLNDQIGCFTYVGAFGTNYGKNGDIYDGSGQSVNTGIMRFLEGYDLAIVSNSSAPVDILDQCLYAFNSRGLLAADAPPAIKSIIGAASYLPKTAPSSYVSIVGTGFTDQAATDWTSSISGSALPTQVGGISVNVNGQAAYVEYVSATQVNFLLPKTAASGIANVDLITPTGALTATVEIDAVAPGLFCYTLKGVVYPASVYATATGVVYVAAAGALAGYNSRPAAPGDIIELYATGCGATNPSAPDGVVLTTSYPAANLAAFQVTIAGKTAPVLFAGLVSPGLWQINVQIPSGLIGGNQPLILSVNNTQSQPNVMITLLGG
jgi:uncharacterized protein (TIGR03437 family)